MAKRKTSSKTSNVQIQAHKNEINYVLSGLHSIDRRNRLKWLMAIAFTATFALVATYIVVYHQDWFASKKGVVDLAIPIYDTTIAAEETIGTHWFIYVMIGLLVFLLFNKLFVYMTYTIDSPLIQRVITWIDKYNGIVATMIPFILIYLIASGSISLTDFVIAYVLNSLLMITNIATNFQPEFKIQELEGEHVVEFWPQHHFSPEIMLPRAEIMQRFFGQAEVDGLNGVVFKEDYNSQKIIKSILAAQEKHFAHIKKVIDDMAARGDSSTIYMFGENIFDTPGVPFFHENYGNTSGHTPKDIVEDLIRVGAGRDNPTYVKAMTVWGAMPFAEAYAREKRVNLKLKKTITDAQREKLFDMVRDLEGFQQWINKPGVRINIKRSWEASDMKTSLEMSEVANYLFSTLEGQKILYTTREAFALDNISRLSVEEGDKIILQFGKAHMFDAWNQLLRRRGLGFIVERVTRLGNPSSLFDRAISRYVPAQNPRNIPEADEYLDMSSRI